MFFIHFTAGCAWAGTGEDNTANTRAVAVSFLAEFHIEAAVGRICQCVRTKKCIGAEKYGKCGGTQNGGLCGQYRKHDRDLRHIRKYILKRNNKSDFERLFLQCFDQFYQLVRNRGGFSGKRSRKGWRIHGGNLSWGSE